MWVKILVGAVAALSVVVVGVIVAMPPGKGDCGSQCQTQAQSLAPKGDCCSDHTACQAEATECPASTCPQVDTNALAACTGGVALQSTQPARATKAHCCEE